MGVISQVRAYFAVVPKARRNRVDLLRWLIRRPQLLGANAGYEVALVSSGRVPSRLKALAELKAGTLITCEFCIDIGSALARHEGITDAQLRALPSFRSSEEFSETDKLVLELAEAMTRIPTRRDDDLRGRLTECFSRAQLVELTSAVAWENHRGRLNQALGVRASGFSDGMVCAVPETGARS
jgi:AhpD family alkylhydroperoxidase